MGATGGGGGGRRAGVLGRIGARVGAIGRRIRGGLSRFGL